MPAGVHAAFSRAASGCDQEVSMNGAIAFHLVLGVALLAPGVWLVTRGRLLLGWMLSIVGAAIGLMGIVAPALHRYLHH
jgi:hypothetical protein